MTPRCVHAMGVCQALALFGDANQATGEGKSSPVETGLTGPVPMALLYGANLFRYSYDRGRYLSTVHSLYCCHHAVSQLSAQYTTVYKCQGGNTL